ncbi:MAG: 4-hydroxyphenylacetate 3-monooxygenase, oxygenase component [Arenicellales bacterium]|jgi:4-hydroxyphenylacetate 3-monooxygenase|nr:4-hydroxyphenylacetate 3-monooxygenase, oxygenase component [Arenicellales bacterium]
MGARTGSEYLKGLQQSDAEIWLGDERIEDVTAHPALRGCAQSMAHLYDMQHDPALRDEMTYTSPTTGDPVGLSFITPRTHEDLLRRSAMMFHWSRFSGGMLGRSSDYINVEIMAAAAAADFYHQNDPRFGENARNYYDYARENDLCMTHTLVNPQSNRALTASGHPSADVALRIVDENADGMVVRGARILATLGPLADEIMVFPSTVLKAASDTNSFAFAFTIPCATPGMKLICRESLAYGESRVDHPLSSRFEEMDTIVVFDDVLVPWDRVFLKSDPELCSRHFPETGCLTHMAQQVAIKNTCKTEFVLGIACSIAEALGSNEFQHVQEKIAECMINLEIMRACLRASEADAKIDKWGVMAPDRAPLDAARNIFPKMYPRMIEILQLLSASSLMLIPPDSALDSPVAEDIDRYLAAANCTARDRIKLFRLAWDVACSGFAGRQVLYERFFFGDPVRMMSVLYRTYDKQPLMDRVDKFLSRDH